MLEVFQMNKINKNQYNKQLDALEFEFDIKTMSFASTNQTFCGALTDCENFYVRDLYQNM